MITLLKRLLVEIRFENRLKKNMTFLISAILSSICSHACNNSTRDWSRSKRFFFFAFIKIRFKYLEQFCNNQYDFLLHFVPPNPIKYSYKTNKKKKNCLIKITYWFKISTFFYQIIQFWSRIKIMQYCWYTTKDINS